MFITGIGLLFDSLTAYYLVSVLTTVCALAGTYMVCYYKKVNKNNQEIQKSINKSTTEVCLENCPNSNVSSLELSKEQISSNNESLNDVNKPAHIAEMVIKAGMTDEQKEQEKEVQRQQLKEIFRIMQEQAEKFGTLTMSDVEEQMKLYR